MDKIREKIRDYVESLAQERGHMESVIDDESLIVSGILDSFAVMRLVVFMEKSFGINFAETYFDHNRFDSISSMVEMVKELAAS
ncbi:MAG: hypothetical protein ABFS18_12025 [Thermodesulfobacteriota bacterium]